MTREDAIKWSKDYLKTGYFPMPQYEQAFEMAIKALSQEPTSEMVHVETLRQVMWERDIAIEQLHELGYELGQKIEPCDDAVSRLDKIRQIIAIPNSVIQEDVMKYQMICELLKDELPSVTQKSGKWHRKHDSIVNDWFWECDKCSCGYQHEYNYCPNCGAKMESEDKE